MTFTHTITHFYFYFLCFFEFLLLLDWNFDLQTKINTNSDNLRLVQFFFKEKQEVYLKFIVLIEKNKFVIFF